MRPEDILSAVSDSAEARIAASIQRSATPLGAQTTSLCSNSAMVTVLPFRIDRKMFVFEVLGDLRRMFGLDLLAGSR